MMDEKTKALFKRLFNEECESHDRTVDRILKLLILKDSTPCIEALFEAKETGDLSKKY